MFAIRAKGEDILLNEVKLTFDSQSTNLGSSNYLTSVGLYNGDTLVSNIVDKVDSESTQYEFTLNWRLTSGTSNNLYVKAVTNSMNPSSSYTLAVTWADGTAYGMTSGETISSIAGLTLSVMTVYAEGSYTLAADTTLTPYDQVVCVPSSDVPYLAAIKVRAQREDMQLTGLTLTATGAEVASLTLYDSDGTPVSYPETVSSNKFVFTSDDLFEDVLFTKNVYKTIYVKGNVTTATSSWKLSIATSTDITLKGLDSGESKNYDAALNLYVSGQGTYKFATNIVSIEKNSTSPSGTISRGSAKTYAIWNVYNPTESTQRITAVTFTTRVGLPSGVATSDLAMFRLVDENDNILASAATSINTTTGAVTFSSLTTDIDAGSDRSLVLQVNTTDTSKWKSGDQMQWSIEAATDVTLTSGAGLVGWAGDYWSIPARANVVTLP